MRTRATLKNLNSSIGKDIIVRNLHRILDIVIIDIDIENSTITLSHVSKSAFKKVKRELHAIGFPIQSFKIQTENEDKNLTAKAQL